MITHLQITPKRQTLFGCLLIALGVFYAYSQVGGHSFIEFDDGVYLFNNRMIIEGLTWSTVKWSFTNMDAANWHPLTWLSLLIDRELFGPRPGGYLLMNVFLHTIAACLCFYVIQKTTRSVFAGLTVGLLFALHPANVENVAWISSRKSILDAIFWFLGILLYVKYLDTDNRKFLLLTFATHLLGLMAKSMHVTFPCALWIIHMIHFYATNPTSSTLCEWRIQIKRVLKFTAPLLLISAYFSAVTLVAQTPALSNLPLSMRTINAIISYERYLVMFFKPDTFAPFYPLFLEDISLQQAIRPLITICLMTLLGLLLLRMRRPLFLLGWLWYLGTMVPVIGIIHVGSQSHADRYLYIPCVGLGLMIVSMFQFLPRAHRRIKPLAIGWLTISTVSLAMMTKIQTSYWKDGVTLFRHSLAVTGDCMTSVISLSGAYTRQERIDEGLAFLSQKIAVAKNQSNKARLLFIQASFQLSKKEYGNALNSLLTAEKLGLKTIKLFHMTADAALSNGDLDLAEQYLAKAKRQPAEPHQNVDYSNFLISVRIAEMEQQLKQKKAALSVEGD